MHIHALVLITVFECLHMLVELCCVLNACDFIGETKQACKYMHIPASNVVGHVIMFVINIYCMNVWHYMLTCRTEYTGLYTFIHLVAYVCTMVYAENLPSK